jgi:23S rRNA (cytosine1962-C5)-methyltransferase
MHMMKDQSTARIKHATILSSGWDDYEMEDSGRRKKLERFGPYRIIRHEPEASWLPSRPSAEWESADAEYLPSYGKMQGRWVRKAKMPAVWKIGFQGIQVMLEISASQHIGIFPEQAANWEWITRAVSACQHPARVLNLFGYTGVASLFAARSGAAVTHVDASRKAVQQGKRNQGVSGLSDLPVRWIVDDALKFISREIRRGNHYDGLVLDPPIFGRGPKGEIWKLENHLDSLLSACREILDPNPCFVIMTAYQVDMSPAELGMRVSGILSPQVNGIEAGDIIQVEASSGRHIRQAIFARWAEGL